MNSWLEYSDDLWRWGRGEIMTEKTVYLAHDILRDLSHEYPTTDEDWHRYEGMWSDNPKMLRYANDFRGALNSARRSPDWTDIARAIANHQWEYLRVFTLNGTEFSLAFRLFEEQQSTLVLRIVQAIKSTGFHLPETTKDWP